METNEYELMLFDRLNVIKDVNKKYDLENNAYISFSGGKDSTILHYLLDMALPNNNIPRVYIDTGIEYNDIKQFVYDMASKDKRFQIIKPTTPIKKMLDEYGYPFKSKQHSHNLNIYENNKEKVKEILQVIENDKSLLNDIDFIENLTEGTKTIVKYIYGVRVRERERYILVLRYVLKYCFINSNKTYHFQVATNVATS